MPSVSSIIPTNEELSHSPQGNPDNLVAANQEVSNEYHLSNPGMPMKALGAALKDDMGLEIIIAIIADPRCGLERRSADGDGYFTFSNFQTSSWGNSTPPRVHGANCYTPLFLAVLYCRVDVVRTLLEGSTLLVKEADVNAVAIEGRTPLLVAASNGRTDCAELLIAKGANVDAADNTGFTPLHIAAVCGINTFVELLIDKGVDVNAVDGEGRTPLHGAALNGHTACAELLIAKGANVDAVDINGFTPLHDAAENGNTAYAELLIAEGAEVHAVDGVGRTPLRVAAANGQTACAELLISKGDGCD